MTTVSGREPRSRSCDSGRLPGTVGTIAGSRGTVASKAVLDGEELVLEGVVVHGDGRGRELGFPTANVEVPGTSVLPADGVYAGWFERADGSRFVAAISVGTRPTYYGEGGARLVEAYLLDFDGDLYGERVRLGVGHIVRGQGRFDDSQQLIEQMHRDVEAVRAAVASG
jgi:riboflavin kinase / FMN adenylyltransferase